MPVSRAFLRAEIKIPGNESGQENWERQKTDGVGILSRGMVLTPAVSGPRPAPGLNLTGQDARPQGCVTCCCRFFQRCTWNVHLSGKGPKAGVWTEDEEGLTPWQNRTFLQAYPLLGEGLAGDTNPQGKRESSRKGAYRANPRGVRAGGRGPEGQEPQETDGAG